MGGLRGPEDLEMEDSMHACVYILPGREAVKPPCNYPGQRANGQEGVLGGSTDKREPAEQEKAKALLCPQCSQSERGREPLPPKCEKGLRGATCLCPLGNAFLVNKCHTHPHPGAPVTCSN